MLKKIAIIGILMAILVPSMMGYVKKSRDMSAASSSKYSSFDDEDFEDYDF